MAEKEDISQEDEHFNLDQHQHHQNHHLNEKKPNPTLSGHFAAKKSFHTEQDEVLNMSIEENKGDDINC